MNTKELVASIVKAKSERLSFDRWVVRMCASEGVYAPVIEKKYIQLLTDISNLPKEQRQHFWHKVRFPKVNASNSRLFEALEFELNNTPTGKSVGQ